jgi:hypothetical protein
MAKPKGLGVPAVGDRGAKVGALGRPGTGKTELLMSATEVGRLFVVDAEGRSQYYDPNAGHGFEALYSKNVKDALDILDYVEGLHKKGESVVFGIDGFSSMWFEQQEVAARIGSTSRGTAKFDSWGPAKKPLKQLYARLFATPVHCIITMRAKPKYTIDDKNTPKAAGYDDPDIERGLPYALDLIVEMNKDELPPGTPLTGENFWALVTKTSGPKAGNPLPTGTKITDPSFAKLMALRLSGNGNGNGLKIAGADVGLQAALATISGGKALEEWIEGLGMDKEAVFAILKNKYGSWSNSKLRDYIKEIWSIHEGGQTIGEEEES